MNPPAAAMREPETVPQNRAEHDRMANAIRALAMDAVEQAKSGHPGLPMGAADIATVLFTHFLNSIPPTRNGPTATGLCSRLAMARCCFMRCSISSATRR